MSSIRVLLIEDEMSLATSLQRALRHSGLVVEHEADGARGLDRFYDEDVPFDVLVVDGFLPGKTGFEIAEAVRRSPRGLHVGMIMISAALRSSLSRREALHAGFDEFYAKPFIVAELLASVLRVAERRTGKKTADLEAIRLARAKFAAERGKDRAQARTPYKRTASSEPEGSDPGTPAPVSVERASATPGMGANAATGSARPPRNHQQAEPPPETAVLRAAEDAPRFLIQTARARRTGLVKFAHESAQLEIVFLAGVPVGAWDNFRENRFGERLLRRGVLDEDQIAAIDARMRSSRERFAEAAIALGHLDEDEALEAIDGQAVDRLRRALGFEAGLVAFVDDEAAVERSAGTTMDLMGVILKRFLDHPSRMLVDRLLGQVGDAAIEPTRDFEPGLVAFARHRPTSALPGEFFAGARQLSEVVATSEHAADEVVAMRMAGMLRTPDDPVADRTIPQHLRLAEGEGDVDLALERKVRGALLRARGRDLYAFLGVDRDADRLTIGAALGMLDAEFGREVVDLTKLGPAREAARELWARLEDGRRTLLHDDSRAAYDETLTPLLAVEDELHASDIEAVFMEGRLALAKKDFAAAHMAFEKAASLRPEDVEFQAFLGWAMVLDKEHKRPEGLRILEGARKHNPQALRPLFFLALAAAQEGRPADAIKLLQSAERLDPHNREVHTALRALRGVTKT